LATLDDLKKTLKELNVFAKSINTNEWSQAQVTTTMDSDSQSPPDTYLGQLHFDLSSGELFVTVRGKKGKEEKIQIEDLNDFKKIATKQMLRKD
jgi:hypothetical protein